MRAGWAVGKFDISQSRRSVQKWRGRHQCSWAWDCDAVQEYTLKKEGPSASSAANTAVLFLAHPVPGRLPRTVVEYCSGWQPERGWVRTWCRSHCESPPRRAETSRAWPAEGSQRRGPEGQEEGAWQGTAAAAASSRSAPSSSETSISSGDSASLKHKLGWGHGWPTEDEHITRCPLPSVPAQMKPRSLRCNYKTPKNEGPLSYFYINV